MATKTLLNRSAAMARLNGTAAKTSATSAKLASLATNVARPSVGAKGKTERDPKDWGNCKNPDCKREVKLVTLAARKGLCYNCETKEKGGKPNKRKEHGICKGACGGKFSLATLSKYKGPDGKETGMCKKDHDKYIKELTGGSTDDVKCCVCCEKPTPSSIVKVLVGFCLPCTMLYQSVQFGEQYDKIVIEVTVSGEGQEPFEPSE